MTQPCFGAHALRDVSQHDGEQLASLAVAGLRDGSLDRKFTAVPTQAEEGALLAHLSIRHAGDAEALDVRRMRGPEPARNQQVQRLSDRLGCGDAKQRFSHGVEEHNALSLVYRNNGLHGGAHYCGKTCLVPCDLIRQDPAAIRIRCGERHFRLIWRWRGQAPAPEARWPGSSQYSFFQ
ncbi:hypothetical protein D3C72_1811910 [compost metagenome]